MNKKQLDIIEKLKVSMSEIVDVEADKLEKEEIKDYLIEVIEMLDGIIDDEL